MRIWIIVGWFLVMTLSAEAPRIHNGKTPAGAVYAMEFVEDLRIEGEEDHFIWTGTGVSVSVDEKGHMFVLDRGGNRILEFDAKGGFVKQIGKEGEGPGEFKALKSMTLLQDKSAVAYENLGPIKRFSYFDQNLNYVNRKDKRPQGLFIRSAQIAANGKYFGSFFMKTDRGVPMKSDEGPRVIAHTGILSMDQKPLITLSEEKMFYFNPRMATKADWWSKYLAQWLKLGINGLGIVAYGKDGAVYTAVTNQYEITEWNSDLEKIRVISRDYEPIFQTTEDIMAVAEPMRDQLITALPDNLQAMVTDNVVRKAVELAEFPPRKSPILDILPMEDGGLLVVHDFNASTREAKADIFDKNGAFIGATTLPKVAISVFGGLLGHPTSLVFKHGYAYALVEDKFGEPSLVRFTYKLKPVSGG